MHTWNKESPNRYWKPQKSDFWLFYNYTNKYGLFDTYENNNVPAVELKKNSQSNHHYKWFEKYKDNIFTSICGGTVQNEKACAPESQKQQNGPDNHTY